MLTYRSGCLKKNVHDEETQEGSVLYDHSLGENFLSPRNVSGASDITLVIRSHHFRRESIPGVVNPHPWISLQGEALTI